jgi:hypothetical protein
MEGPPMSINASRARSIILGASAALTAVILAACSGSPAATSATNSSVPAPTLAAASSTVAPTTCADSSGDNSVQQVDTAGYRMVLAVGDREAMYTQDEVSAKAPMTGEMMVAGTMMDPGTTGSSGGGMMSGNTSNTRHVEVAICDLATGSTVTGADVTMMVAANGAAAAAMPVAEMRGLDEPATQTHYGNNVPMTPGTSTVAFTVNGQTGTFTIAQ